MDNLKQFTHVTLNRSVFSNFGVRETWNLSFFRLEIYVPCWKDFTQV